jgi:hypothetical protein
LTAESSDRAERSPYFIALIFAISFLVPIVFFGSARGWFSSQSGEVLDEYTPFPEAVSLRGSGSYIRIKHREDLLPVAERDLLILGWFKLPDPPSIGDRNILLLKYDSGSKTRSGYGLALSRVGESVRPEVYWRGPEGKGGWYAFPDMPFIPSTWFALILSFREGKYLGLHTTNLLGDENPEIRLLGGYDVTDVGIPANQDDLIFGAPEHSSYRGQLGPLGLFSLSNLSPKFKEILKDAVRRPLDVPGGISPEHILLWMPQPFIDLSSRSHEITPVRLRNRR